MNWFGFEFTAFLWVFIILNIINVVIQTIKSIATVKWGAWGAAITNALAYGLYTIVVVYMTADGLGLIWKALIIGLANLIGVFIVKQIEIKKRKDKLWKVEATINRTNTTALSRELENAAIPYNYTIVGINHTVFNCYCNTQKDSASVKNILSKYKAKYFVTESKIL